MTVPAPDPGPIAHVVVGMRVLDIDEEQVGTVADVHMGDPQAVTTQGQQHRRGLVEGVVEAFTGTEPKVPEQHAEELLRKGYIKIDVQGAFAADLYAAAEEIRRVDKTVRLSVPRRQLVRRD